ncbi:similar to helicase, lymphoid-specific isoform 9 [Ectocarpus siliculosus]|uniref:Similar to helicase, lymphoid-specific isoform 9 n=1 Tax=Ectocarpus siliculosus TaxID=2880 RepID=D8LSU0_ECTSI|nr:similar to helicase, lymphoid-specific isoform 9 [Ectocarpus siliculosus]|eukprot:CBN75290.1 similar to helicase, lymphoid-specific isoform 9 [Ectocarpus siliculosus]
MSDGGGTSSGSEDVSWFKKPTTTTENGNGGGATGGAAGKRSVRPAQALASPAWLPKNDAAKMTPAQRTKNVQRAKDQRQKARGKNKGGGGGGKRRKAGDGDSSGSDEDYGAGRSKRAARRAGGGGGAGKGKGGAAAGRRGATRNRHGDDDESEESCETGDDSDEESEGEFDDGDDSSDEDDGSDDEPELTDASSSNGDNSNNPNEEEGAAQQQSASAAAAAAVHSPTLDANAAGILAIAEADDLAKVQARARAKAKAKAAGEAAAAQGEEKKSAARGGGGAKAVVVVDDDDGVEVTAVKAAAAGVSGKGPSGSGGNEQGKKRRRVVDSDEDSSDDGGGGGDVVEVVVAPPTSKPSKKEKKKKKKKKRHSSGYDDDGMDGSDRGSDSDADEGARARKVLSECSALSKKLASVISTWAGTTTTTAAEEGGSAAGAGGGRGALEICSLKGGGKAVTTNEEVQEACPGLKLNPYQLVGVNWMCLLRDTNVNGVLADEMGLGKTVQSIAFFALLRHRRKGAPPRRPHLVVVPSSVLDNWASELEKFCPALDFVKYHGSQKERAAMRHSLNRVASDADREAMPDIILTTYVVWERESSADDRAFLKRFRYDYMVLDEGHSIKNIKSSRFQRLRVVAAKHRLLLSGTPVQNNLGELLALLSFLMPEIFRSDVIETLLEFLGNNADEQASSSSSSFQVREVRGMLAPFVLRRLKSDVLKQLVAKNESLEKVPLSKVAKEVSGYSDFDLHQVCSGFDSLKHLCLSEETLFTSAKMERLRALLPQLVSEGHRILLFSQWTRLLDLLEVLLGESMGMTFCRLDGSTPVSERKALIDKFGADTSIPVFLLSTRAGGLGINLTAADTVILHDVDFNPENDRQAEDRCHRIGQTKPVTVIRMVAAGTVDEDIYLMGERKKEVNQRVLNDSGKKGEKDAASTISGILKRAIQVHVGSPP